MLNASPYTIVTGGALGVDLEAEKLARNHGMAVEVYVPPYLMRLYEKLSRSRTKRHFV